MKNLNRLLLLPAMLVCQTLFAQNSHLTLSEQFPSQGAPVSITYDPTGTKLENKENITATVYYMDGKKNPAAEIALKPEGKSLKGYLTVPVATKAFFFKINKDTVVDNNNGRGYFYMVYNEKQPVQGAYASEALFYVGMGRAFAKVAIDNVQVLKLYKQEIATFPESEKEYGGGYYRALSASTDQDDMALLKNKLAELKNSSDEKSMMMAVSILTMQKKKPEADSLLAMIKRRYPDGTVTKNEGINNILKEKDVKKQDSLYQAFVHKFPENALDQAGIYDLIRTQLVAGYLKIDDFTNCEKYLALINNKTMLFQTQNNVARKLAQSGKNLELAERLSKQSVDIVNDQLNNPVAGSYGTIEDAKRNANSNTFTVGNIYGLILYKQGKYAEGLKIIEALYNKTDRKGGGETAKLYAQLLNATKDYAKAKEVAETGMKAANASVGLDTVLKESYIKINGNDKGFNEYVAGLKAVSTAKIMDALAKTMINQPAPVFTLKDADGKTVSLSDLKGKIVIVDFWATWCGPCKMSFPGMQMAVNKYKKDP
ncbi:MAG TPA: TlpA disulfide reductase family protein, partial [Bacteroidia bacterium]|nr:TlpA disulfide reductase family protein [Bacteroidia bacterium]